MIFLNLKSVLLVVFLVGMASGHVNAQEKPQATQVKQEIIDFLIDELSQLDRGKGTPLMQVQNHLGIATCLNELDMQEQAQLFEADAAETARLNREPKLFQHLLNYAFESGQFELAESLSGKGFTKELALKQRIIQWKIHHGNVAAFDKNQFLITDFHTAVGTATALVEAGAIEQACDLVTNLVFHANDGNEPVMAEAMTYSLIAMKFHATGDIKQARHYIDKAIETGGNLYYVGYTLHVDRRVVYDELTKDLQKFAKRGARYGEHMGDELVSVYVRTLYKNGKLDAARQAMQHLSTPQKLESTLTGISIWQAGQKQFNAARKTLVEIEDPIRKFQVRVHLAKNLYEAGRRDESEQLTSELETELANKTITDQPSCDRYAALLGQRQDLARIRNELKETPSDLKMSFIKNVFRGLANMQTY